MKYLIIISSIFLASCYCEDRYSGVYTREDYTLSYSLTSMEVEGVCLKSVRGYEHRQNAGVTYDYLTSYDIKEFCKELAVKIVKLKSLGSESKNVFY